MSFRSVSAICKALSDENRLRILGIIGEDRKSVSRIVEESGLSQPLVSHHLKELRLCGLLRVERSGPFVYYQVADGEVIKALDYLGQLTRALRANREEGTP